MVDSTTTAQMIIKLENPTCSCGKECLNIKVIDIHKNYIYVSFEHKYLDFEDSKLRIFDLEKHEFVIYDLLYAKDWEKFKREH